jgi:Fe-S-cluster containining protein
MPELLLHLATSMTELTLAEPNHCGECRACCIAPSIPWLDKPAHTACRHLSANGCGIQATKPDGCRNYFCTWRVLTDNDVSGFEDGEVEFVDAASRSVARMKDFRPDRCGMVVQMVDDFFESLEATMVMELRPGAAEEPLNQAFLVLLGRATKSLIAINGPDGHRKVVVPKFDGCEAVVKKLEDALRRMGRDVDLKGDHVTLTV